MPIEQVLITVKTYPTPAKKGIEVSCTAGITSTRQWIRLFPLPFRYLADAQKFKKYQWIEASVTKAPDPRPESHIVDLDSIKVLGKPLPTNQAWKARKDIVLPLLAPSLCSLVQNWKITGANLGIFKPKEITDFIIEPEEQPTWTSGELGILSQESLLDKKPYKMLEKIPYKFFYRFICYDPHCKGHRLSITDWEVGQSYRSWSVKYGARWEQYFRQKYEIDMIQKYDAHFYVGTLRAHPNRWIIIGLFYPPKEN